MGQPSGNYRDEDWPEGRQLLYVLDVHQSSGREHLVLDVAFQERKKDGNWSKPKFQSISQRQAEQIQTEPDAAIVPLLFGAQPQQSYGYGYPYGYSSGGSRFTLSAARCRAILPLLGRTGRLFARFGHQKEEIQPIAWDDRFALAISAAGRQRGRRQEPSSHRLASSRRRKTIDRTTAGADRERRCLGGSRRLARQ